MSVVHQFRVKHQGVTVVQMPRGAVVLHAASQHDRVMLWSQVDQHAPVEDRTFLSLYTGFDEVPSNAIYIGTTITDGGDFVTHVYEVPNVV